MTESRTWYVLQHRRGPAVTDGESVFDHPGFTDHVEFLRRLAAAGRLVAAGPLSDVDGDGLTVIEADSLEQAAEVAAGDDPSVRNGVLLVTVRPWQLVLAPILDD